MSFILVLAALVFLMVAAYRGFSIVIAAPVAALSVVFLSDPSSVAPVFSGVFMEKMVGFLKLYFPVFMLGAVFGKLIEISGFAQSIVFAVIRYLGRSQANLVVVLVCALLTYGGVSLFVVVFAVYPFAAELYRQSNIPKRLMPGAIALGAFSFTMDALPGTPQIQNIIPSTFFHTTSWAAPMLGTLGAVFLVVTGLSYLEWRRRVAAKNGEGYGSGHINEPQPVEGGKLPRASVAIIPLIVVGVANFWLTKKIPQWYGAVHSVHLPGLVQPVETKISTVTAIWAVEAALLLGIVMVLIFAFKAVVRSFAEGSKAAVGGAMLAAMNTASEYGFGGVIAALPGFVIIRDSLQSISDPLLKASVSVTTLAGITGSASGGMSIALAAMSDSLIAAANAADIPLEVLHRVVAMASGGMDTLPHNGAVITLLAVTGLTHRQAYKEIFAITIIKTLAALFVVAMFYLTGLV